MSRSIIAGLLTLLVSLPLCAQEKSVNPGINKSFEKPNVADFVARFEKEGRDEWHLNFSNTLVRKG